jgi:hypothetical protein
MAGRPLKEINWTIFEDLCCLQCTQSEIASVLKIHPNTLSDRAIIYYKEEEFSTVYKRFSENGKCSLRRYQFNLAKKNTAMAIWLGKQWLGQREPKGDDTQNDGLLNAALQFLRESTVKSSLEQELAHIKPLLDQRQGGEKDKVQTELGTADINK